MNTPVWHWTKQKNSEEIKKKCSVGWKNLEKCPFKKSGEERICPICGKKFYVKRCFILKGQGKYCSVKCNGISKRLIPENKHSSWKGDNAGYVSIHQWVTKHRGKPQKCSVCGIEKRCYWHNISHLYKRDLSDYISLCASCHKLHHLGKLDIKC